MLEAARGEPSWTFVETYLALYIVELLVILTVAVVRVGVPILWHRLMRPGCSRLQRLFLDFHWRLHAAWSAFREPPANNDRVAFHQPWAMPPTQRQSKRRSIQRNPAQQPLFPME